MRNSFAEEVRESIYKSVVEILLTKRVATAEVVGLAVEFLFSSLHITGSAIRVDGGATLFYSLPIFFRTKFNWGKSFYKFLPLFLLFSVVGFLLIVFSALTFAQATTAARNRIAVIKCTILWIASTFKINQYIGLYCNRIPFIFSITAGLQLFFLKYCVK